MKRGKIKNLVDRIKFVKLKRINAFYGEENKAIYVIKRVFKKNKVIKRCGKEYNYFTYGFLKFFRDEMQDILDFCLLNRKEFYLILILDNTKYIRIDLLHYKEFLVQLDDFKNKSNCFYLKTDKLVNEYSKKDEVKEL